LPAPWARRVVVAGTSLLFVVGSGASTSEFVPRARAVGRAFDATRLTTVLRADTASSGGASVDRRVPRAVTRTGRAEALLVLSGDAPLARARASIRDGDSRALLRSVVPAYARLKRGVRARIPRLDVVRDYQTLPILHVRVPSLAVLERAAADPSVVGIAANSEYRAFLGESLPLINQPAAVAAGYTGASTSVAVLDSGVDHTRADFGDCAAGPGTGTCTVVVSEEMARPDGRFDDAILHGTNVAGIVVGVAPDTKILALDVFDGNAAFASDVLEAIDFTIANQSIYNVRAMNLSFGDLSFHTSQCGGPSNPYVAAFANARAAGIVPVVAAGNSRFSTGSERAGIARPACTPGAVSVGAVYDSNLGSVTAGSGNGACTDRNTSADKIACFSQVANFLTVLAPGVFITAAGVRYGGTSQAAPHVAGAVAAIADASPTSDPTTVDNAFRSSGPVLNDRLVNRGFHRLDILAAIAALGSAPPPPPPPLGSCTIEGNDRGNLLEGTPGDDVICGNGGDDVIVPGGGTDTVIGGGGIDFVSFENASSGVAVDLALGNATTTSDVVTLEQVEGAIGSPFADELVGNGGQNDLVGLGGRDFLDGGGGFDLARFDFASKPIRASLAGGVAHGEGADRLLRVEGIVGGSGSDELEGSGARDVLDGRDGNDLISGLARADTLFGGGGADALLGGRGEDDLFGGPGADTCDQQAGHGTISSC
jgi:Ca2+-binding RTX toxin-like protein